MRACANSFGFVAWNCPDIDGCVAGTGLLSLAPLSFLRYSEPYFAQASTAALMEPHRSRARLA